MLVYLLSLSKQSRPLVRLPPPFYTPYLDSATSTRYNQAAMKYQRNNDIADQTLRQLKTLSPDTVSVVGNT
jgi:hypothetical protein